MLASLIYSNSINASNATTSVFESICPLIDMFAPYQKTHNSSTSDAYLAMNRASFAAQFYGFDINSSPAANQSLEFCGFHCSMLTINAHDDYNQAISSYYYQLNNGSCNNLFASTNWYSR